MSSIGYFPGCSLSGTAAEYDQSLRAVAACMGIELQEIPDWVCCGATSAHAIDHEAALCLAADNLAKARRAGMTQVLAPCAMCYSRLASASHELAEKPGLSARVATALGQSADLAMEKVRPLSVLNWLATIPQSTITGFVTRPLKGLKVACYYGCLLVRPPQVTGADNAEAPRSMERIITALGGEPVRWSMATECCGASFALSRKEVVLRQTQRICQAARKAEADAICLACPMCHANIDVRQAELPGGQRPLPTMYLTQLMGLAFGLSAEKLRLKSHFVPVVSAVKAAMARG